MTIDPQNLERFRALIRERLGLRLDDNDVDHLAEVLQRRLHKTGQCHVAMYLDRLALPEAERGELQEIANELAVAETYFFRHPDHFRALAEAALPDRLRQRGAERRLRLLSAGCASGEEPYSLAMLVRDALGSALSSWEIRILGIDASASLLERAAQARYTEWSLRATPLERRQQSFRGQGRECVLDEAVRTMVAFETRNLLDKAPDFWQPERFDIIFFRNVSIYFSTEATKTVIARLTRSLVPGGFLFLGPSETLRGISQAFHLCHTHGTFYYQKRDPRHDHPSPPRSAQYRSAAAAAAPALVREVEADASWVQAISRASARIASLAGKHKPTSPSGPAASLDLAPAWDLLRQERYKEALAALGTLPPHSQASPDALLLRAVVLTNAGDIPEAQRACQQVLAMDELDAGAHYLMALCDEHAGDRPAALQHDQTAVYLDPTFAMPHLHLGLLAKRSGDLEAARREWTQALVLLEREGASRILLFGGGFSREALVQFCRAELRGGAA